MPFVSVPNAGQSLGATRDQVRSNIDALKASLAINHVDLDLANVGKHKFMQMPSQAAAPATAADELAFYVKTPAGVRLFLRQVSSGTEIQMSGVNPLAANDGYTFLPGGLLMQWGRKSVVSNVVFPTAFDAEPYSVTFGLNATSSGSSERGVVWVKVLSATGFTWGTATSNLTINYFSWIAIGPKA